MPEKTTDARSLTERALDEYRERTAAAEAREAEHQQERRQKEADDFTKLLHQVLGIEPLQVNLRYRDGFHYTVVEGTHIGYQPHRSNAYDYQGARIFAYVPCGSCGGPVGAGFPASHDLKMRYQNGGGLYDLGCWLAADKSGLPPICLDCAEREADEYAREHNVTPASELRASVQQTPEPTLEEKLAAALIDYIDAAIAERTGEV